jgi:hypothetical protein
MNDNLPQEAIRTASEVEQYLAALRKEPIKNHDEYVSAANLLKQVKAKFEEVEQKRLSITRPMDLSKQRIMDFFRGPVNKLKEAEQAIKQSMVAWQSEVARIAKIAQDKIDADAKAKADAEKAALEAQAVKLVQAGKVDQAADLVAASEQIEANPVQLTVVQPRIADIRTFETWGYEIVDASLVPREFLCIDEKKLGQHARATKGMVPVAGIRFISKKGIAA